MIFLIWGLKYFRWLVDTIKYTKLIFGIILQHTPHVETTIQHEESFVIHGTIYFNDKSVTFH
jgi:hypothetical protein